jgi:hypothetical protein
VYQEIVNNVDTYSPAQLQTVKHLGKMISEELELAEKRADTAIVRAERLRIAESTAARSR